MTLRRVSFQFFKVCVCFYPLTFTYVESLTAVTESQSIQRPGTPTGARQSLPGPGHETRPRRAASGLTRLLRRLQRS